MDQCTHLVGYELKISDIIGLDREIVREVVHHRPTEMITKRMTTITKDDREAHVSGKRSPDVTTSAVVARNGSGTSKCFMKEDSTFSMQQLHVWYLWRTDTCYTMEDR